MSVKISKLENDLMITFDYSAERINKIKSITGYRWDANKNEWLVPLCDENIDRLKKLFSNEHVVFDFICNRCDEDRVKAMDEELKLKGYSFKTRQTYTKHIRRFLNFINKKSDLVSEQDIRKYILLLLDQEKSHSYANQAISSIKFLCNDILHKGHVIESMPRPKKENKLPNILSYEEVKRILKALDNEKHRAILFLVYSSGLRVGEVVRLRPEDIDSQRMLIHVSFLLKEQ